MHDHAPGAADREREDGRLLQSGVVRGEELAAFLSSVLDGLADPVFVKDEQHRWVALNAAFCAFMGYSRAELLGKSDFDFVSEDEARVFWEKDAEVFSTGRPNVNEEHLTDASGRTHVIQTKKTVFRDVRGHRYLVGVIRDVTAEKEAEAVLRAEQEVLARARDGAEAAARLRSEFLANVSHELRTPLNAIVGMTELLLGGELQGEQREFVDTIRQSGDALLALISDILDFSKIDAGKLTVERRPFELIACVRGAVALLAPRAARKGLELRYDVAADAPAFVEGDARRLRQVLVNLLSNAVKFTDRGEVELTVRQVADDGGRPALRFDVRDTGIGIPEERRDRLFRPFSQVDASTTRKYGGTGLGLAISKALVELMGGRIWFTSVEGQGSTFSFSVPCSPTLRAPEAARPVDAELDQSLGSRHPLRVLIAEDNAVNRRVVELILQRLGYAPHAVSDGAAALEAVRARTYDLVLMDLQMPFLDGVETCRRIQAELPAARRPRIVAVTANAMRGERERCLAAGMDAYAVKPIQPRELRAILERTPRLVGR